MLTLSMQDGSERIIQLPAVSGRGELSDVGCDHPEAIKVMIDFMYFDNHELAVPLNAQIGLPQPLGNLDDLAGEDERREGRRVFKRAKKDDARNAKEHIFLKSNGRQMEENEGPVNDALTTSNVQSDSPWRGGFLAKHSLMYVLGLKYDFRRLQTAALSKFEATAKVKWTNENLTSVLPIVFGSRPESDEGLRKSLMNVILNNLPDLLGDPVFEKAIEGIDGLTLELLKKQTLARSEKKIACKACGTSKAQTCAASSRKNPHAFVTCDCKYTPYCSDCSESASLRLNSWGH